MTDNTELTERRKESYAGVGLILGSAVGFSLGAGNPLTAGLGAALGLILGAGLDAQKNKRG